MLIKGLIGTFALKAIQNCEAGFKILSYKKISYLGLWLPRFNSQIFQNSALNLCYFRLCIQNSLAQICLDDSKLSPRQSTHKDNLKRLLIPLELKNEYFYRTQD